MVLLYGIMDYNMAICHINENSAANLMPADGIYQYQFKKKQAVQHNLTCYFYARWYLIS